MSHPQDSKVIEFIERFRAWVQTAHSLDAENLLLQSNHWSHRLSSICKGFQQESDSQPFLGLLSVLIPAFKEMYRRKPGAPIDIKFMEGVIEKYDEGVRQQQQSLVAATHDNFFLPPGYRVPPQPPVPAPPVPAPPVPAPPVPAPPVPAPPVPAPPVPTPPVRAPPVRAPDPAHAPPVAGSSRNAKRNAEQERVNLTDAPVPAHAPAAAGLSRNAKRKAEQAGVDLADMGDPPGKKVKNTRPKSTARASSVKPEPRPRGRPRKKIIHVEDDDERENQSPPVPTNIIKVPPRTPRASSRKRPPHSDSGTIEAEKPYKVNDPPCTRCLANGEECRTRPNSKGCHYCLKISKRHCSLVSSKNGKEERKAGEVDETSGGETNVEQEDESEAESEPILPSIKGDQPPQQQLMDVDHDVRNMNAVQPAHNDEVTMVMHPVPRHQYPIPSAKLTPAGPSLGTETNPKPADPLDSHTIKNTLQEVLQHLSSLNHRINTSLTDTVKTTNKLQDDMRTLEQWTSDRLSMLWENLGTVNRDSIRHAGHVRETLEAVLDETITMREEVATIEGLLAAWQRSMQTLQPLPVQVDPAHPPSLVQESPDKEGTAGPRRLSGPRSPGHPAAAGLKSPVSLPPVTAPSKPSSRVGNDEVISAMSLRDIPDVNMGSPEGVGQEASAPKQ